MASFNILKVRLSDDQHEQIRQYGKDQKSTLQETYTKILQSFLDSLQPDFVDYIAPPFNIPEKAIAVASTTHAALVETAHRQGRHMGTIVYTAVILFLRNEN